MFDFFSFGHKAPSDPLATLKSVTVWMNELPLGDVYAAHEKVVAALVEFNEKHESFTKDRLDVLMHLDEHAREMQHALSQQYLRNPRMSKVIESRLWNAVHAYYWEMTRGYHAFIMDYVANPTRSNITQHVPLITTRAIHDFARIFKWRSFRYEKVEDRLWKRLHNLYRFAEFERFDQELLMPYTGAESPTSCASEYVHALMLDTVNTGAYYPKQIELLDYWLVKWSRLLRLEKECDMERHVYLVNLQEGQGARRVRNASSDENCRYWSTSDLISHIEELRARLLNGEMPARLGLSEDCRLPGCLEFLDDIACTWAPKVQRVQRKHERAHVMKMIEVVHGLNEICTEVKQDNVSVVQEKIKGDEVELTYEEMLDVRLYGFVTRRTQSKLEASKGSKPVLQAPVHERWVMENESEGEKGYGATLNEVANDWIRLGKLIGLKPERGSHWRIGVVRRMNKLASNQHYVGIEILTDSPLMVMMKPRQANTNSGYLVNGVDAVDMVLPIAGLYVHSEEAGGNQSSLVIDSSEYSMGRVMELNANAKSRVVLLKDVIERGDDWLRCSFNLLSDSGAQ
jgi:hypothetical protein